MKKILLILALTFFTQLSFSQSKKNVIVRNIPISYTTEKSDCLINEILTIGKTTYVTVDFITFKYGEDEDGMDTFELVNNNNKKRTFIITSQTEFSPWDSKKTIKGIIYDTQNLDTFFNISTSNGKVISLFVNEAG